VKLETPRDDPRRITTGMAITPEQRSTHALCGAKRKGGKPPCRKYAGEGTNHFGFGRCRYHLGNTLNMEKHAIKEELQARMVKATFGKPEESEDVSALQALLQELAASTSMVGWLREQISALTQDDLGTPTGKVLISLFAEERDRKARYSRMAIESGVDEAKIRVHEAMLNMLGQAVAIAAEKTGLSDNVKRRFGAELRTALAEAEAQPQALLA
jgi:hypothetical protein